MNCKPGDLAVIVRSKPEFVGYIVEVLKSAPAGDFDLPDGHPHVPVQSGSWILKTMGSPLKVRKKTGTRLARYVVAHDSCLRPIRDGEGEDEMIRIAGLSQEQGVKA